MHSGYEAVIGLEVHAQLRCRTKMFCGCDARFGGAPNDQTCPVCLGLPGALPVPNARAVDDAILFGLAVGTEPRATSIFARKNYFYPDLPKGYQISQFEFPIVAGGRLTLDDGHGGDRHIVLRRAHLEEDAGQSIHDGWPQSRTKSYVNLNRAGVPLLEIVTEPVLHTADEVYACLVALRTLLRYLDICDGNMEEGSLRCDANVSIRPRGETALGTRTELKNLNSFNNVRRGVQHEIDRQIATVSQGQAVEQCTLLWDAEAQTARVMRTKEDAEDYRYFPEPDLPPLTLDPARVTAQRARLPELPHATLRRFRRDYGLGDQDAVHLTGEPALAAFFEATALASGNPRAAANWIRAELLREVKDLPEGLADCPVTPDHLADLIRMIDEGGISGKIGKDILAEMLRGGGDPRAIASARGLRQISDDAALDAIVSEVLAANPGPVAEYRAGKTKVMGYLMGQAMKASRGQANPAKVKALMGAKLDG